ncbi:predicted oxidoreductase [Longilinea arvoryzae]|uniref:Predicted oxidoreductase n=1 Tax=Longilinea arvoryzae TaxID=360412 RepID=A0A0S7BJI4_9CHLR|nr:aldo/keto reductase [Longilinea arvoryzae]GAP13957.1 predicted oxidoreductase [Longilinea arvoryzae]
MEYRNLGQTGLKVSELCMGSMQFGWTADEGTSFVILDRAFEAGINFIDTANVYSRWAEGNPGGVSETIIGKWMKSRALSRDQLVIATKVRGKMGDGPNDEGLSRVHILRMVEDSLRRLQTDYIDLYQTHHVDPRTPIDETLGAMDTLVRQGKVRYIGCSNYPAWQLMEALWTSDRLGLARFDSLQPHYSLAWRREFEQELAPVCKKYGIGVIPYSPLAGGFLTGKYRRDQTDADSVRNVSRYFSEQNWNMLDVLAEIGTALGGKTLSQVALAWQLSQEVITSPIIGPRKLDQLEDNLGAVGLRLDEQAMQRLDQASNWK